MKTYCKTIILLLIVLLATGCTAEETTKDNDSKLNIYTSIYPIQFAVERIGGESIHVETVYPPGVDAHSYEPTSKDMTDIAKSDAFIYLGAGMEAFAETAADALEKQDISLIEIGVHEELFHVEESDDHQEEHHDHDHNHDHENEEVEHDGHNHGDHDPHIWIDPLRMIEMANIIKEELITLNPSEEAVYNENFEELKADLLTLDEQFIQTLQPKANKEIIVSHAGFGYWEERYGLKQIAINGLSSSSEPSQKELVDIIDQAEELELEYIIFEQNSSNRVSEIIQSEIGAESLTIHNLSVLTDEDITNNEDYLSLMKKNIEVLDKATE
ncbi:metal ABC transporter solute-binding protein, Zn/Mn family [Oceanobacillus bengalensis]|uniref:Adhesin n=1 Tax=Oceanobacillus bengalensis TaxID=1435466 RepID=A0A494YZ44_9BACI|nr:zinc ABC transporter substrate-binding protein [Oceanobacillus bengalensis]RKQ14992.1 adhesin [Oceanobacillus bengalensis]